METRFRKVDLADFIPVDGVYDSAVVSVWGDVTFGWELSLPSFGTLDEQSIENAIATMVAAIRALPPWTIVHRQDVLGRVEYSPRKGGSYLGRAYERHFAGRGYLRHRQFLYLTFSTRGNVMKRVSATDLFGKKAQKSLPGAAALGRYRAKADEFISLICAGGLFSARPLTTVELEGERGTEGLDRAAEDSSLLHTHLMLHQGGSHSVFFAPDSLKVGERVMLGYKVSDASFLPTTVDSTPTLVNLSRPNSPLLRSWGTGLSLLLPCEHEVNQYIMLPGQKEVSTKLTKRQGLMTSFSKDAENRIGAEDLDNFSSDVHREGSVVVYSHFDILAWADEGRERDLRAACATALGACGMGECPADNDLPVLYLASVPGGAAALGEDNWALQELSSMVSMGTFETFTKDIPGGTFRIVDRLRHVPMDLDFGEVAQKAGLIKAFNKFILGPTGTGKSFFTNSYVRNKYDAGGSLVIVDVGHSYQGLCTVINEESGGEDGQYRSWSVEYPFSFAPFAGWENWLSEDDRPNPDDPGFDFFLSCLRCMWTPAEGVWSPMSQNVLMSFIVAFLVHLKADRARLAGEGKPMYVPVFDDWFNFYSENIAPAIRGYSLVPGSRKGSYVKKEWKGDPWVVGGVEVSASRFDAGDFQAAMASYAASGSHGFLLNDRNPEDLFSSRFVVFEVEKLQEVGKNDEIFYSLCILCIMNAYQRKVRYQSGAKELILEEAWSAVMNSTFAGFILNLEKTCRKYSSGLMVVTQQLSDLSNSDILKDTIIANSDVKILLDQSQYANNFEPIQTVLGLTDREAAMALSVGKGIDPAYGMYREVFIALGSLGGGVYAVEVSPEEARTFQSERAKKAPLFEAAARYAQKYPGRGFRCAINESLGRDPSDDGDYFNNAKTPLI